MELTAIRRLLCLRCPQSKFMALLTAEKATEEEMLRLVYEGIDGCLALTELYGQEFPKALQSIMSGNLWIPHHILREYIRQTNFLLNSQLRPDPRLTARENQAFRLMIRRLSNKEIAAVLGISERTVKFHISNIFSKLKVQDRRELLTTENLIGFPQPYFLK
jgi:DNA-binding NarL/FixJ family response regulator